VKRTTQVFASLLQDIDLSPTDQVLNAVFGRQIFHRTFCFWRLECVSVGGCDQLIGCVPCKPQPPARRSAATS